MLTCRNEDSTCEETNMRRRKWLHWAALNSILKPNCAESWSRRTYFMIRDSWPEMATCDALLSSSSNSQMDSEHRKWSLQCWCTTSRKRNHDTPNVNSVARSTIAVLDICRAFRPWSSAIWIENFGPPCTTYGIGMRQSKLLQEWS